MQPVKSTTLGLIHLNNPDVPVRCQAVRAALSSRSTSLRTVTDPRPGPPPPLFPHYRCSRPYRSGSGDGLLLFTFLSMRTVKTSLSFSGSLLSTRPWLNSWTGWLRRAVRFELDRPISFPLRGCSSAAIFSGRPVFTTVRVCDSYGMVSGRSQKSMAAPHPYSKTVNDPLK